MHKLVVLLAAAAIVAIPVYADAPTAAAQATQHPVNQSGAQGRIDFTNVPGGLAVTGTATGLKPSLGRYVRLVYDIGSVPGGPDACEPTAPMPGMLGGFWAGDALGKGMLIQVAPPAATA